MASPRGFDSRCEDAGPVARAVIGLEDLDGDGLCGKPTVRACPEPDRGRGFLVGQDFAVGEAAVAVDRGVDESIADHRGAVVGTVALPVHTPAAAGWDAPELPDVHLDLFTWMDRPTGTVIRRSIEHTRPGDEGARDRVPGGAGVSTSVTAARPPLFGDSPRPHCVRRHRVRRATSSGWSSRTGGARHRVPSCPKGLTCAAGMGPRYDCMTRAWN